MSVSRPCYVTRDEVRRALDVKQAAFNDTQIDRQIVMASESVEDLCQRVFYPMDATRSFDWPNFQYAYPWRLWLDKYELAAIPTSIISGPYLTTPVVIPVANVIFQPVNEGPPFRWIELRRDLSSAFGNNTTPQNDIQITGTFGWGTKTNPAGALAANVGLTDSTISLTIGSGAGPCVGDVIVIDSERMIVSDVDFMPTGVSYTSGLASSPPNVADNTIAVPNGSVFSKNEIILVDSEAMYINYISGNNLVVQRAWDGTVLTSHTPGPISARRLATVVRGMLGTAAATHTNGTAIATNYVPGLVKELALAEAVVGLTQEIGAYSYGLLSSLSSSANVFGGSGRSQQREPTPGLGLIELRDRVMNSRYSRKARSRVV